MLFDQIHTTNHDDHDGVDDDHDGDHDADTPASSHKESGMFLKEFGW